MARKILAFALMAMVFAGYAQKPKLGKALRYYNDNELAQMSGVGRHSL